MKQNLQVFLCLLLGIGALAPNAKAQLVNFEDTWQEFLRESKTSSVSELVKPASSSIDYPKYCLMYANSNFCAGDIKGAEQMMAEVKKFGEEGYTKIPNFKPRYDDLTVKIAASYKIDGLWKKFLLNKYASLDDLKANEDGKAVCEKGTLAKYFYLTTYALYCKGEVKAARDNFENRILMLVEKTSFKVTDVEGLAEEVKMMKSNFMGLDKLNPAWKKFIETGVSPGFDTELPLIKCYTIPNMKAYMLRAMVDVCKNGSEMLEKIKDLMATNTHPIEADLDEKIQWLTQEVKKYNGNLANLNKAWAEFIPNDELKSDIQYMGEYCEKDAQIKAYTMEGTIHICDKGQEMIDLINQVKKEHNPKLDETTKGKIAKLEAKVKKQDQELADLNKAWEEFSAKDTVTSGIKFGFDYCDKAAVVKAYIMDGTMNACDRGQQRLEDIAKVRKIHKPELDETTTDKLAKLEARVKAYQQDLADLNAAWTKSVARHTEKSWEEFPPADSAFISEIRIVEFYCDKIAQVKSWTILGHIDACKVGQKYLDMVVAFKKQHSLTFDKELSCEVDLLRAKVYQCRYFEMVLQARKETHEERERFGPESAKKMYSALNTGKQPCETTVQYKPLGNIGIKYTISTFLCQNIDLAKMGDPEYYKKIATWVDTEVLQKYCEANMRCKKDFFIYLEGHTDGNPFEYASYKESLGIPKGYSFTHFYHGAAGVEKTLERELTTVLKSNTELGLARAWTVKKQLEFMNVPITIGAYEHPKSERGGEYRRVDIDLNITNLLLDFYEKRLKELLIASGIGDRPATCK